MKYTAHELHTIIDTIIANKNNHYCSFVLHAFTLHKKELQQKRKDIYFDADHGIRAIMFIESFRHRKGDLGRTKAPLVLMEWQKAILFVLFGWRRTKDGRRRYTDVYIEVARKNGKTLLGTLIALYVWLCEGEPVAEAYTIATKRDQAKISWMEARAQIISHPTLSKYIKCSQHKIEKYDDPDFTFKHLGKESKSEDGLNPYMVLVDEYHAHMTNDLVDVMKSGMIARTQPMILYITTAGDNIGGVCYAMRETILRKLQGEVVLDHVFGIIFTLDEKDTWDNPDVWIKANPNIDIPGGVQVSKLQQDVETAKIQPALQNKLKTKNLNIWTQTKATWIPDDHWVSLGNAYDISFLYGKEVVCAIDMSAVRDFSALCYATMPDEYGIISLYHRYWLPATDIGVRSKADGVPYDYWATQNFLTVEQDVVNPDHIGEAIITDSEHMNILEICYDPHFATSLATTLSDAGFIIVPIKQSYDGLGQYTNEFERIVFQSLLRHNNNPVTRWHIQCTTLAEYNDKRRPMKPARNRDAKRIDGTITAMMAVGRLTLGYVNTHDINYNVISL